MTPNHSRYTVPATVLLMLVLGTGPRGAPHDPRGTLTVFPAATVEFRTARSERPAGLAYDPSSATFLVLTDGPDGVAALAIRDRHIESRQVMPTWFDPSAMAFDVARNRLVGYSQAEGLLREVPPGPSDAINSAPTNLRALGVATLYGMVIDADTGRVFLLDAAARRLITVSRTEGGVVDVRPIASAGGSGIAFNPENGRLYVLAAAERRVHELDPAGAITASFDLSTAGLVDPQAVLFAPSVDPTDDPTTHHLVVLDRGRADAGGVIGPSRIVEVSLVEPPAPQSVLAVAAPLVRITPTSGWNPASPDPAGIAYVETRNSLFVTDGEVEEDNMAWLYQGRNVWESSLDGRVLNTGVTVAWSPEPTGVARSVHDDRLFVSDDDQYRVFEIDPGADGMLGTNDDAVVRSLRTKPHSGDPPTDLNCIDPEGVSFDSTNRRLFIFDGEGREVWIVDLGANAILDGPPNHVPPGDDVVTHFDTDALGITDPEGGDLNAEKGTLWLISSGTAKYRAYEISLDGRLLRTVDITAASPYHPAGVAYAPASQDPRRRSLYIVDRGVDNDSNRTENDGTLSEFDLGWGPPGAPLALTAVTLTPTQVALSWSNGSDTPFDDHHIERSLDGGATFTEIAAVAANVTTYTDNSVPTGTFGPSYRVRSANANGFSGYSNLAWTGTGPAAPSAPANLTATAVSSSRIDLAWTNTAANADTIHIERSLDATVTWFDMAMLPPTAVAYTDVTLAAGATAHFRIHASNTTGDSPYSNIASATTPAAPPDAPSQLTATAVSPIRIDVAWSDVAGETGYTVERSLDGGDWVAAGSAPADATSFVDTGLTPSTTYRYRVFATAAGGISPPSVVVSATTLADTIGPTAPGDLKASVAAKKIMLTWTASTDADGSGVAGYQVWRSAPGTSFALHATVSATTFTDTGLSKRQTYSYYVVAVDRAGNTSAASATISATAR